MYRDAAPGEVTLGKRCLAFAEFAWEMLVGLQQKTACNLTPRHDLGFLAASRLRSSLVSLYACLARPVGNGLT